MFKSRKFGAFAVMVFFLCAFAHPLHAQDEEDDYEDVEYPRIFYAGFVAGANFSQVDGDNFAGYHRVGLNVGGIGYARIRRHLAFSYEILYSQRGAKSDIERPSTDTAIYITNYGVKLGYAEVPIMINYFDQRRSHFGLGLSYSQLVSVNEYYSTYPATNIDLSKYPFNKQNLDVVAGVDLHLYKGLFLNIKFQYSLTPIRTNVPPYISRSTQYNNTWTVRLMYLFF